jgi:Transposase IS116/IS110/IS902 family
MIAMPELGDLEAGQAANLAGLAPIARQSGRWTGRSFICGGRADVRQALYARPRRSSLQSGHEGQIRPPHPNRKTRQSRPHRDHAKAGRPRKRPPKGQSPLDAKNRLINTVTCLLLG